MYVPKMRNNKEIKEVYDKSNMVAEIKSNRPRCLWHDKERFQWKIRRTSYEWLDNVEENLRGIGFRRWLTKVICREKWAEIVQEAKI